MPATMSVTTTRLIVSADGAVSMTAPLPAGEYIVSLTPVGRPGAAQTPIDWSTFPTLNLTPRDPNSTFSREEIYGDDGR